MYYRSFRGADDGIPIHADLPAPPSEEPTPTPAPAPSGGLPTAQAAGVGVAGGLAITLGALGVYWLLTRPKTQPRRTRRNPPAWRADRSRWSATDWARMPDSVIQADNGLWYLVSRRGNVGRSAFRTRATAQAFKQQVRRINNDGTEVLY